MRTVPQIDMHAAVASATHQETPLTEVGPAVHPKSLVLADDTVVAANDNTVAELRTPTMTQPTTNTPSSPCTAPTTAYVGLFDLAASLARLGGDQSLLHKLIEFYQEDYPPLLKSVEAGMEQENAAKVELAAHSLKGLASNFGASETMEAALKIEDAARKGDLATAATVLPELTQQTARLSQALAAYLVEFSS